MTKKPLKITSARRDAFWRVNAYGAGIDISPRYMTISTSAGLQKVNDTIIKEVAPEPVKKAVKKRGYARPVIAVELKTGKVTRHASAAAAARKLKLCKSGVSRALSGEIPYLRGYKWRYLSV